MKNEGAALLRYTALSGFSLFMVLVLANAAGVAAAPFAFLAGCVFALANLAFYRMLVPVILQASSAGQGLVAVLALLKLPLIAVLVYILCQQSALSIAYALAGSLIFIPAGLVLALINSFSASAVDRDGAPDKKR